MGLVKQMMMEADDADWEPASVFMYCPECKEYVEASTELPVVYEDDERTFLPVAVQCCSCDASFDGYVETDWNDCNIELDDHPEAQVEASPLRGAMVDNSDDYDQEFFDWLERVDGPKRPLYEAFIKTSDDIKELTAGVYSDAQSQMLARMLLVQSITALETFLADTLISIVARRKVAQGRLLRSKSLSIGETQFKLVDALGAQDFAKDKLLSSLKSVSFHNLKRVEKLFQIGIGVPIMPEGEALDRLQQAIKVRHDCVHRNGANAETGEVHEIDQAFLIALNDDLVVMVEAIDEKAMDADGSLEIDDILS